MIGVGNMAYKALYRSYRPQTFDEVAGQEHIITTLKNAIKEERIAHAYLFAGPRGTGKTTVAKLLSKAINCTSEDRPCGICENCKTIADGSNPDVIEIDAASNNGVDEVRDLIDKVKYAPIKGKYKVYIIDEVHMMSTGAFNALLKTLEEPPTHIVFILATTEPHKILPTIISRCQRFDFTKVEDQDIIHRLEYVLQQENMQYEKEAVFQIAKLAEGGMRDALSILEQCLAYSNQLTVKNVQKIYGLLSMDLKLELILHLLSKDTQKVLADLDLLLSNCIDIKHLTFDLIDVLKDIIIYKNTKDISCLFVLNQSDIDKIVPYILVDEAFEMIDILVEASMHYSQSLNATTYFEIALLKISNKIKEENKISLQEKIETNKKDEKTFEKNKIQPSLTKIPEIKEEVQETKLEEPVIETKVEEEKVKESKTQLKDTLSLESTENQREDKLETKLEESVLNQSDVEKMLAESEEEQIEDMVSMMSTEDKIDDVEEQIEESGDIKVLDEDILNILVQAKRPILKEIQERWEVISRYRYNLNTAKEATMLCDGKPVAAAPGGIIITFEHMPQVNVVNDVNHYLQLQQFLKEVLGDKYDVIAMQKDAWLQMRQHYIDLSRQDGLPEPKEIVLHHIVDKEITVESTLNEAQQTAVDLFGDLVEIEE